MRVRVKGYLTFRKSIGEQTLTLADDPPATLGDLLRLLLSRWDAGSRSEVLDSESGTPMPGITVLVNGRAYAHLPRKLQSLLKDGDEVSIFPPMAGG